MRVSIRLVFVWTIGEALKIFFDEEAQAFGRAIGLKVVDADLVGVGPGMRLYCGQSDGDRRAFKVSGGRWGLRTRKELVIKV